MDAAEVSAPAGAYRPISEFVRRCLDGERVLDIGYKGSRTEPMPIVPHATGVDLDFPGYDGVHLPFPDCSQDTVFASHCLEHIEDYRSALSDWYRVVKTSGHLIIMVPHQHLYERKAVPPSRWTGDHKRFYTPRSLLTEIDETLPLGSWRLRSLRDVDDGFDYSAGVDQHAMGLSEIEAVIQRISAPSWASGLVEKPAAKLITELVASLVLLGVQASRNGDLRTIADVRTAIAEVPLPPYRRLAISLTDNDVKMCEVTALLRPVLATTPFDEAWYLNANPDIRIAATEGRIESGRAHFINGGYFEGRLAGPLGPIFD